MRAHEMAPSIGVASASTRRMELERFEAQLAEWTALIGQCRAHARRSAPQVQVELDHLTDELQLQRNAASVQLLRLKHAADTEWESEKAQIEAVWRAVRASFQKIRASF
ncbi:hypothetical protein GETHLI_20950 [Geothrix limicola]|uniref:Uncharacterized protein n=1 Tax=Geothrix limicola TaxID=2927978 RepID=A0ABQ5QG93_9BACT|nr:hypothetical protein [Geothrix limicola]GLH73593.1 hypothetical protein GETHLI_20950 [Geothrix limicola]